MTEYHRSEDTHRHDGEHRYADRRNERDHHGDHDDDHGPSLPPPPVANLSTVVDDTGSVAGALTTGGVTDDASLTLSGTCQIGSTIGIYDGATLIGQAVVSGTTWTFEAPILDGVTYSFNVIETDSFGQASAPTAAFVVTGDMTAPTLDLTAVTDDVGSIASALVDGGVTDDASVTLSGTCEAGSVVTVYDGATVLGTATVTGTTWTFDAPVTDGATSAFSVTATDLAGNTSAPTAAFTITGDMTSPVATVTVDTQTVMFDAAFNVTVSLSEPVTSLDPAAVSVPNATLAGATSPDGGLTWVLTYQPDPSVVQNGVQVTLDPTAIADTAGNGLIVSGAPTIDFNTVPNTVAGTIVGGPVLAGNGLVAYVFDPNGVQIGTGTVNPDGTFNITTNAGYVGPALVQVVDTNAAPDYMDEGIGAPMDLTVDLRVVIEVTGPGTTTVNVNVATEAAVE